MCTVHPLFVFSAQISHIVRGSIGQMYKFNTQYTHTHTHHLHTWNIKESKASWSVGTSFSTERAHVCVFLKSVDIDTKFRT